MAQDRSTQRTEPQAGRWPRWARGLALTLAVALGGFLTQHGRVTAVAIWAIAALTAASGILVLVRMYETHPRHDRLPVPDDADLES